MRETEIPGAADTPRHATEQEPAASFRENSEEFAAANQASAPAQDESSNADLDATAPGAEGPIGTGTEGADDILETDRSRDAEEESYDEPDYPSDLGEDEQTAAEQGNREGDEMSDDGEGASEIDELAGDDLDAE
jgi:hypothetical protein